MNTGAVYCWFDWEDNTTTVNSINVIKEPRKPWREYQQGEKVLAKLPQFGMWNGVIVEINESKKELERKMNARIHAAATAAAAAATESTTSSEASREAEQVLSENIEARQKTATAATGSVSTSSSDVESKTTKGKNKKENSKKRVHTGEGDKAEEKAKKKMLEAARLDARNRQLEEMIVVRRKQDSTLEEQEVSDKSETENEAGTDKQETENPGKPTEDLNIFQQSQSLDSPTNPYLNQAIHPYWHSSGAQFQSPDSAFRQYSFVGDLMSPGANSYHSMSTQRELQDKCYRLEEENARLKKENEQLRQQLDQPSQSSLLDDVVVTPKKVAFLQQLVTSFQKKAQTEKPAVVKQRVYAPTPLRLTYGAEDESVTTEEHQVTDEPSGRRSTDFPSPSATPSDNSTDYHWENCATSSCMKKVPLHPSYEVYLTQGQMSHVKHVGAAHPRKMTVALLDALFSRELLAKSSAKGSKKAHNASLTTSPLPSVAVQAIKAFVLNQFKKDSGEPCLSEATFNDIINSKCATSRRALNR